MRKHTKRRRIINSKPPMCVVLSTIPSLGLSDHQSIVAIADGCATTDHFDNLADCRNIMTLAAAERNDEQTLIVCELALHALLGIKDRHAKTGKIGATGEELKALKVLVSVSEDFWNRQSGDVFARHYDALKRAQIGKAAEAR